MKYLGLFIVLLVVLFPAICVGYFIYIDFIAKGLL